MGLKRKMKLNQNPREMVDLIDELIKLRVAAPSYQNSSDIEQVKRDMTDYLISTDPRKGVFYQE